MKKIIALCGAERSGKTTTLNLVIEKAKKDKSFNIIEEVEISNNDKNALFYYKGKKIAITTAGDYSSYIKKNFSFCKKNNCDILITGVREPFEKKGRSKKSPKEELEEQIKKYNTNITYIYKAQEKTAPKQKSANLKNMTDIISEI